MNKKALALAMFLTLLISAIPIFSAKAQVPNEDTFIDATIGGPETCDPAWAYDTASGELIFNVYEPLLTFAGPEVDEYVPMLATEWKLYQPPDPLAPPYTVETWYFKLRTGVPWQDPLYGTVTTADVEYSIERGMVMDHDGGPQWMLLEPLLGLYTTREYDLTDPVEAAILGHMIDDAVQKNATHVWFNLYQSYAAFQQILSQTWACIVCKAWTVARGNDFPGFDVTGYEGWVAYNDPAVPGPMMSPPDMMGTGPYMLDYWDTDPDVGWFRLHWFLAYWGGWDTTCPDHDHVEWAIIKGVADWSARKAMFISEDPSVQVDSTAVPRGNTPELIGEWGIRYKPGLATLASDGLFFNIDVDPASPYCPQLGGVNNGTLFRDRYLRLALTACLNITQLIEQAYLGEASPRGNPIISGIAYFNASKPTHGIDIDMARYYFKMAWGGKDPDGIPNSGDEIPGDVWNLGFNCRITSNTGNVPRRTVCLLIEVVVETLIGFPSSVDIIPMEVAWSIYIPALYSNQLGAFVIGWLADFPDPHNWVMPFQHTVGDFSGHQNIEYGLDPDSMDWKDNTYGPVPYYNYKGELVTELNNTYVDGLISTGITLPDTPGPYTKGDGSRNELYEELMDIFYAECFTDMLYQAEGRHYERDWLCGWFYNPIRPGYYIYDLWKQDVTTQHNDVGVYSYAQYNPSTYTLTKYIVIHNYANRWVNVKLYQCVLVVLPCMYHEVENRIWFNHCQELDFWIGPHATITIVKVIMFGEALPQWARIVITHWVMFVYINTYTMTTQEDDDTSDNMSPLNVVNSYTLGDLGGGTPPTYFKYDGKIDGKDLALFLILFKGKAPWQWPNGKPDQPA